MNEKRLREVLRETPIDGAAEAEERGLRVVTGAFEQRRPQRRVALPRLAVALAAGTLLAALALTPAGAAVGGWIGDVLTVGVRDAEPGLTEIPGGGRLLVSSPEGSWVVAPDGSRRLIGDYDEATWSPHGLFVAAASGHTLSAVEPDGDVHWSLSAGAPVADPRWSPSGLRIAYRAGEELRVVAGDGTGDKLLDRQVAPVAAAWLPLGLHVLAYIDAGGGLRVVNTDSGETIGSAPAPAAAETIASAPDGSLLLVATRRSMLLRTVRISKLATGLALGPARRVPLPAGASVRGASFSPGAGNVAVLLDLPAGGGRPQRSELEILDPARGPLRPLFTAPGHLSDLAFSPDGSRLLIGWPDADQWLFIPAQGGSRPRAIGGVAGEFSPGSAPGAGFPRVDGWCCGATAFGG